jgi:hypothetical protein
MCFDFVIARRRASRGRRCAQRQGSHSFGLRAALSVAKLYQSTGRPIEAHAVLTPALEGFSPTPEMPQIAEAQALVAALDETDNGSADNIRAGGSYTPRKRPET